MAEPQFTPAPWSLGTVAIVIDGGYYQAPDEAIIYCGPDFAEDENEIRIEGPDALANAQLIIAAPELYAALLELADVYENCGQDPESIDRRLNAFDAARDVLAKARGEG